AGGEIGRIPCDGACIGFQTPGKTKPGAATPGSIGLNGPPRKAQARRTFHNVLLYILTSRSPWSSGSAQLTLNGSGCLFVPSTCRNKYANRVHCMAFARRTATV